VAIIEYIELFTIPFLLAAIPVYIEAMSRDSSIGIATGKAGVRFPARARDFPLLHSVQTGSGAHPSSYPIDAGGSFHGGKVATM
jgi:hypothetical protein